MGLFACATLLKVNRNHLKRGVAGHFKPSEDPSAQLGRMNQWDRPQPSLPGGGGRGVPAGPTGSKTSIGIAGSNHTPTTLEMRNCSVLRFRNDRKGQRPTRQGTRLCNLEIPDRIKAPATLAGNPLPTRGVAEEN